MAKINLSDTYEKLLSKRQYKISNNKEPKAINKQPNCLTKSRGYSK